MTDATEQNEMNVTEKTPRECAILAAQAADEKKATDIMIQEMGDLTTVTDYFVIVTASNERQVEAIVDAIEENLRVKGGVKPLGRECEDRTWMLLDFGAVIVHVFQPQARDYYRLEELWNDAPVLDLAKEAGLTEVQYSERIAQLMGME